jgi:hypothetical protein
MPLQPSGAIDHRPLGRRLGIGARGDLRFSEAIIVEVVRRRALVDLDRPVGEHARVRLAVVALHRDRPAAAVGQLEAVVVVEDAQGQSLHGGRDGIDDGSVARVALVGRSRLR